MIKTAIICPNDILIAFDERGRQILEYHSQCDQVKEKILKYLRQIPYLVSSLIMILN